MDPFFTATDPRGIKIICTEEAWQHILDHREDWDPEDEWEFDVIRAIENASAIYTDSERTENVEVYYCKPGVRAYYMKVIVEFIDGTGYVVTAFEASKGKKGELLVWMNSSHS